MTRVSVWVICGLAALMPIGRSATAEIEVTGPEMWSVNNFRTLFERGMKTWWTAANHGAHFDMPSHVESTLQTYLIRKVTLRLLTQDQRINQALHHGSQISHAFLVDAHKLATLRARWPQSAAQKAWETLVQDYHQKIGAMKRSLAMSSATTTDSLISKLNLEEIIQGVILDLSTDPVAVFMAQFLATLPLKIHSWSEYMFTNKTFGEIFGKSSGIVDTEEAPKSSKPVIKYPFHWDWMANLDRLNEDTMKPVKFPLSESGTGGSDDGMRTLFALLEAGLSEAEPILNQCQTAVSQLLMTHLDALGASDLLQALKPAATPWNQTLSTALDLAVLKVKLL